MKKLFFVSLLGMLAAPAAFGATSSTPWWLQPTICRISTTNCYVPMGAGYDAELWDASANCRGMKLICPRALTAGGDEPVPMGKTDLSKGTGIKADFDINALADGCFGARKTSANGTLASVNGKYINVYCRGVLENPDEIVATGEITLGAQPTCGALAENGYAAVVNGRCYGKYYNPNEYYIECGSDLLPTRLIVLNGADYMAGASANTPSTTDAAKAKFDSMYKVSQAQHEKYFKPAD